MISAGQILTVSTGGPQLDAIVASLKNLAEGPKGIWEKVVRQKVSNFSFLLKESFRGEDNSDKSWQTTSPRPLWAPTNQKGTKGVQPKGVNALCIKKRFGALRDL